MPAKACSLGRRTAPTLTTSGRVVLQIKESNCLVCHGIINPLGFTLEHFDAVGRFRDKDNNKPVDSSGDYRTRSGRDVRVKNAHELAVFLVDSDEAQTAFVEQLFHYLVRCKPTARANKKNSATRSPRRIQTSANWRSKSWPNRPSLRHPQPPISADTVHARYPRTLASRFGLISRQSSRSPVQTGRHCWITRVNYTNNKWSLSASREVYDWLFRIDIREHHLAAIDGPLRSE